METSVTDIVTRQIERPPVERSLDDLKSYEGAFILQRNPPINIILRVENDTLRLFIPDHMDYGVPFIPTFNDLFFSTQRPWELKYTGHDAITLYSWGVTTAGLRI